MNVMLYSCPQCYTEFDLADDDTSVCPECGHGGANDADALRRPSLAGSTAGRWRVAESGLVQLWCVEGPDGKCWCTTAWKDWAEHVADLLNAHEQRQP